MAITAMSATTFFFLLFFFISCFISMADAACFFFNVGKCTSSPFRVLILDSPHAFRRNRLVWSVEFVGGRLCIVKNIHLSWRKLRLHSAIRDINGGDEAENFRIIPSFMKKTSCSAGIDGVNLGHLHIRGEIPNPAVKNFNPRARFYKIVNLRHVFPRGIEASGLLIKIPSDSQKNEKQKHESYMQFRRTVLQIETATHELSDFPKSEKQIVTVPSTFPGNTVTVPSTAPGANVPVTGGKVWCVGKKGAMEWKLQEALDYACGEGGADCRQIQTGGSCYNPNTVHNHASYAFNMYYQNHPSPASCNFSGAAELITINPSTETCIYPSSSSSSSSSPPPPVAQLPGTSTPPGTGCKKHYSHH